MIGQRLAICCICCFVARSSLRNNACLWQHGKRNDRRQQTGFRVLSDLKGRKICHPSNGVALPPVITHQSKVRLSPFGLLLPFILSMSIAWTTFPLHAAFAYPSVSSQTDEVTSRPTGMACVARMCSAELKDCIADSTCFQGITCFVQCAMNNNNKPEGVCQGGAWTCTKINF